MTDAESLRRQLTAIKNKTSSADTMDAAGWWVGDIAGERKVRDDLKAGRVAWCAAHSSAESGLAALDKNDIDMAEVCLTNALWLYIEVLETRSVAASMRILDKPAKKRGRPQKIK